MGGNVWTELDEPEPDGGNNYGMTLSYSDAIANTHSQVTKMELEFDFSNSDISPPDGGDRLEYDYYFCTPDHSMADLSDMLGIVDSTWSSTVEIADLTTGVDLGKLQKWARIWMAVSAGAVDVLSDENDLVSDAAINGISAFEDLVKDIDTIDIEGKEGLEVRAGGLVIAINQD
ncbi:hypothetical protein [Halopiger aswanensis]|nr:hypothetical protein [Halopiger aswanensis]